MFKYLIAILILLMIYRFTKKREDKVIINKKTKIDFKKVKDAEFEDNE